MTTTAIYFRTQNRKVNESTHMVIVARFQDRSTGTDVIPTNCRYRLDSDTHAIRDWTELTPGNEVTIELTPAETAISNATRVLERKVLAVAADYGLSSVFVETMPFHVRNNPY